jgi:integrase
VRFAVPVYVCVALCSVSNFCFYKKIPNLATLADIMGHSDVNTTRIYTATSGAEWRRQLAALRLID